MKLEDARPGTRAANWWSELLLRGVWRRQHLIPVDPPTFMSAGLRLLARTALRPQTEGVPITAPIFIVGTPRCGSTMVQDVLSRHPQIAYLTHAMDLFVDPELFRAVEFLRTRMNLNIRGERYLKDSVEVDGGSPSEAMRFWGTALKLDPFELQWPHRRIEDFSAGEIEQLKDYLRHVLQCFQHPFHRRLLSKSPALLTELQLLQDIFPDARFIHLVRDGRMVANSLIKLYRRQVEQNERMQHPMFTDKAFVPFPRVPGLSEWVERWGAEDLRTTANVWNSSIDVVEQTRPGLKYFHEVRYEDILTDPVGEFDRILEFCALTPASADDAAYQEALSRVGVLRHSNRYDGFDQVEKIADDNLRRYGYIQ